MNCETTRTRATGLPVFGEICAHRLMTLWVGEYIVTMEVPAAKASTWDGVGHITNTMLRTMIEVPEARQALEKAGCTLTRNTDG